MTLKDFLEKHGEVEIDEEKEKQLKEILGIKEIENQKRRKPERNEEYYYVDLYGDIENYWWKDGKDDNFLYLTNNCFKTKEEAEFYLEKLKVYYELKNFAVENGEKIDLYTQEKIKYVIAFSVLNQKITIIPITSILDIGQIYFSSKELAEQAIEKVGEDRIKKYLFGVE